MTDIPVSPARDSLVQSGELAPDFTLKDQDGKDVRLSDFRGKNVVLYFYPKSNSAGCTAEACQFRDSYEDFKDAGAEVIGVSADAVETQSGFARRFKLPFVLLSDPGEQVTKQYGVKRKLGIMRGRATFIIDRDGVVRESYQSMNPAMHMPKALSLLNELKA